MTSTERAVNASDGDEDASLAMRRGCGHAWQVDQVQRTLAFGAVPKASRVLARRSSRPARCAAQLWLVAVGLGFGCSPSTTRPEQPESSIPQSAAPDVRAALQRLYAPSPLARARAASRLGGFGDRARLAIPYLTSMLRDSSQVEGNVSTNPFYETPDQVAFHAGMALIALGDEGEARLMATLSKGTDDAKRAAVYALGESRVQKAAPVLAKMLLGDENPFVRETIPLALQKIGNPAGVDALITAFEQRSNRRTIWAAAGAALAGMEDPRAIAPALKMLEDPKDATRRHLAAQMLGRIKDWPGVTPEQLEQATAALTRISKEPNEVGKEAEKSLKALQP